MSHFNAHPVTPDMGLRGSVNAMLSHVAWSQSYGHDAPPVYESNYQGILRDFPTVVVSEYRHHNLVLSLAPVVKDSDILALLVETLITLCNDYPVYDDQLCSETEHAQLIDYLGYCDGSHSFSDEEVAYALRSIGACTTDSDGSPYVSKDDYSAAVEFLQNESVTA